MSRPPCHETPVDVRFNEVDPWGIVWHGHYLSYIEIARNRLGRAFRLGPDDLVQAGFAAPVVDVSVRYRLPARFGDQLIVRTLVEIPRAAKVVFHYEIRRGGDVLVRATTTQVLVALAEDASPRLSGPVADVAQGRLLWRFPDSIRPRLEAMAEAHGVEAGFQWCPR